MSFNVAGEAGNHKNLHFFINSRLYSGSWSHPTWITALHIGDFWNSTVSKVSTSSHGHTFERENKRGSSGWVRKDSNQPQTLSCPNTTTTRLSHGRGNTVTKPQHKEGKGEGGKENNARRKKREREKSARRKKREREKKGGSIVPFFPFKPSKVIKWPLKKGRNNWRLGCSHRPTVSRTKTTPREKEGN